METVPGELQMELIDFEICEINLRLWTSKSFIGCTDISKGFGHFCLFGDLKRIITNINNTFVCTSDTVFKALLHPNGN